MTFAGPSTPKQRAYRVLCVDDNELGLYINGVILHNEGYDVLTCSDASKAAAIVKAQEIDLAVLDYQMPVMNGAELAAFCKAANPDMKVILFTSYVGVPNREFAFADLFIPKSEGIRALLEGIEALLPRIGLRANPVSPHRFVTRA